MPFRSCEVPLQTLVHFVPFQCRITPPLPAAQTSLADAPQTLKRVACVIGATVVQLGPPVQRRTVPCSPTTQASLRAAAHTALRRFVVPLIVGLNAEPVQCRIAPPSPTAQTSSVAVPPTPC